MRTFKIIDLAMQALLLFATLIVAGTDGYVIGALLGIAAIGCWHLISAFTHLFFHHPAILRKERSAYWVAVILYFVAAMAVMAMLKQAEGADKYGFVTMMVIACLLGIWYISICLREFLRTDPNSNAHKPG